MPRRRRRTRPPSCAQLERVILLRVVDEYWMEHIDAMQDLRQGIRLRAYAQTNPVDAYKKESLEMFEEMVNAMKEETVRRLYSVRLRQNQEVKRERVASRHHRECGRRWHREEAPHPRGKGGPQ